MPNLRHRRAMIADEGWDWQHPRGSSPPLPGRNWRYAGNAFTAALRKPAEIRYPEGNPDLASATRPAMIDHTGIGVADVSRSARFYDAALGALGLRRVMQLPENVGADGIGYGVNYPVFWIDRYPHHSVRQHTAFVAKNRAEVDAFHAAATKAGGTDNRQPGPASATLLRSVRPRSRRQ
jgi:catechol 2,3-dioxygenase-like lactoylglutathione lyase family enzyme